MSASTTATPGASVCISAEIGSPRCGLGTDNGACMATGGSTVADVPT
eukprot:CAMPEP_0183346510 /NCGR_PEP_ID=MMETSP0164_2-20130417/11611_1 /TAXON_ID=221442 /ORGANISM="Coccolithus pelagicus ssp braarudi, Strain PLY182g" /LENGTH=46 /DNA_ID= /DNA_START= /DNA_END= /DNA_ORIENTATION=